MLRTKIRIHLLAIFAVGGLAGPLAGQVPKDGEFRWSGTIATGKALQIVGINGEIEASPASGGTVEVRAVKRAEDSDPASVTIEVVEDAEGVRICAVYPQKDGRSPRDACAREGGGHSDIEDNDVVVDFTVRVPVGITLVANTVNGGIEATGLGGDVRANTVNGGVNVSGTGIVEARTVNGGIEASMGKATWTGTLAFETVNGSITVRLPASAGAQVEAHTVNGELSSDFPLTIAAEERWGPKQMTGTIGQGGGELELETVNGSIELRRG